MSRDPLHGRGARTNASGRYERFAREAYDDGWVGEDGVRPLETIVTPELAKTIISTNQSPDISSTNRSIHIAAANMVASIVMRGPTTPMSVFLLASISKPSCS